MCSKQTPCTITPDMTVAQLREHFPDAELALRSLAPSYGAISSEQLRTVVAGALTLQQMSERSGVGLGLLMTELRKAAGIDDRAAEGEAAPAWVSADRVVARLDARPILASGAHPVPQVMSGVDTIGDGVYELVTPFVPTPLIDMVRGKGFESYTRWEGDDVHTYFRKR